MVYAFSRDGALPLSRVWHKVNRHDVPVNAVWLSCLMGFVMALPVCRSSPFIVEFYKALIDSTVF